MNSVSSKYIKLDINIGDQLTSVSCGHMVVELVKFLLYQRLQIPYSYQWLKYLINQKKACGDDKFESFQSSIHFKAASSTLESLDFTIKSILQEINGSSLPEEVCVIFGATPVGSKEVYRFLLPPFTHKPQCHSPNIASDNTIKFNVLKTVATCEDLSKIFFKPLAPTNMYVLLQKKCEPNKQLIVNPDSFTFAGECRVPMSCKVVVVDLRKQMKEKMNCCRDFQIYNDVIYNKAAGNLTKHNDICEFVSTDTVKWYQCNYVVKGFKDCLVNGSSISNTWLNSNKLEAGGNLK